MRLDFRVIPLCFLLLVGTYYFVTGLFPTPSLRAKRTITQYSRNCGSRSKRTISFDLPISKLSLILCPLIRISALRQVQISNALKDAGNPLSPEEYIAQITAGCLLFLSAGLLLFPLSPFLSACVAGFAVYYATASYRDLFQSGRRKAIAIEQELPRFAAYINQSLTNPTSALLLLERYRTDNSVFAEDLNRTVADIKTSNFETALLRMSSRYNSEHLSMIIHGLISIHNGDDVRYYFSLLEKDFTEIEIQRLRREIKKIPGKMRKSMIVLYAAIALLFFTPILILIINNLGVFFT